MEPNRNRIWGIKLVLLAALTVFVLLLWSFQVTHGPAYWTKAQRGIAQTEIIPAARGRLLDRTGRVLVQDETEWQVQVSSDAPAEARRRLARLCREGSVPWTGEGPVREAPAWLRVRLREDPLDGVTLVPVSHRRGPGPLAPHALGRVGRMDPAQWAHYGPLGYKMDELVGQDGAEAAFESLLRGTPGQNLIETDTNGTVTEVHCLQTAQPGQNVTLTLDWDLQEAAQEALSEFLDTHPQATGGAAAVLDVRDGGVLALASQPGYDPETFSENYSALASDPAHPVMNRAVQGLYAPGSTFKLVTAAAALEEGILTPETKILDTGRYTYYKTPQPQCWLYRQEGRTHGLENVREAIRDSCNLFFYDAGRRVGIERLEQYAHALGLGEPTGIELSGEPSGVVAGPEYTHSLGKTWYEGNVLSAAIGQENNRFTPLQLAHMTATLASGGTRWQVHLLRQAGREEPLAPKKLGEISFAPENLEAIQTGMEEVTRTGSLSQAFRDLPFRAAAKTGSAQVAGAETSNAVLVCFAPYDDPILALAVVVEQGGSGSALGPIAAHILKQLPQD